MPTNQDILNRLAECVEPEVFNRLLDSVERTLTIGRLRFWQEELFRRHKSELGIEISDVQQFARLFEGAVREPVPPPPEWLPTDPRSPAEDPMELVAKTARLARQFERGIISAEEFVVVMCDEFAYDASRVTHAAQVVALIPDELKRLLRERMEAALAPGYLRQAFAIGGRRRTEEEEREAARRETAREQTWARALRDLL